MESEVTHEQTSPVTKLAIERLPDEIIEQILRAADPDSFASLILLNSNWRRVSQQAHLYVHHLTSCSSYAASHNNAVPKATEDDLAALRRAFAREVKRNLFEAYLRPTEITVKLISNSISSSSSPGGERLQFSPSPRGHHMLAYNSARIYVLDMRERDIRVARELKILRRPISTCITDNASLLAVLSSEMQVDVYDLKQSPPRRKQSMVLDHPPRTIAMSPCGSVLAAAYEGGIEVSSLNPGAIPTERRSVKCDGIDSLAFSFDGTQLLGTTTHSTSPNTVVLTAPYYDPGSMPDDNLSSLWTTSILFPNTSRDCSHAVLLQDTSQEEASWAFTYDRSFETFRAVRIDDLRNGQTYFTGPIPRPNEQSKLLPCTSPSATYHGDLVSAGFQGRDIWLYGVPEDLEAVPDCGPPGGLDDLAALGGRRSSGPPSRTPSSRAQDSSTRPQWKILCDKLRNTFVWGTKVVELEGVGTVRWVAGFGNSSSTERLVITAGGALPPKPITEEDNVDFIDGGRMILLDFDYSVKDGQKCEVTIEVGTNEPEALEEEVRDIDTEVAIVRRRTVAQRRGPQSALLRAATTAASRSSMPPLPPGLQDRDESTEEEDDPLVPRRVGVAPPRPNAQPVASDLVSEEAEDASIIEAQEAVDAPYSHDNPRSTTTLRRAATAAASNRRRQPDIPIAGPVPYRRADGRREHPHESDADNWVPPPPPYERDAPVDLPAFLRHPAITPRNAQAGTQLSRQQNANGAAGPAEWHVPDMSRMANQPPLHIRGYQEPPSGPQINYIPSHRRRASDSTTMSRPRLENVARPTSSPALQADFDDEDIYDVSPPDSPRPAEGRTNNSQPSNDPAASDNTHSRQVSASSEQNCSPEPADSRNLPALNVQIPSNVHVTSPNLGNGQISSNAGDHPPHRRLSNAQTWPTAPAAAPQRNTYGGFPLTAPPLGASANELIAAAFPHQQGPEPQGTDLRSRGSRPFSNRTSLQRVPVGSRAGPGFQTSAQPYQQHVPQANNLSAPRAASPPEEPPLIISTPGGVSGAFDIVPPHGPPGPRSETTILAPVPRHPHPTQSNLVRPAVERLDPLCAAAPEKPPPSSRKSLIPGWLSAGGAPPSSSSNGHGSRSSVSRKPSRAERSAAKNILDARRRGWRGSKRMSRKKSKRKAIDHDEVASSAAWTDVSGASRNGGHNGKGNKKCAVM